MIKNYFFGQIDGEREVKNENYNIDDYYYKYREIDLLNDDILILFGRKGSGKTYIAQKNISDAKKGQYNAFIIKYTKLQEKISLLKLENLDSIKWEIVLNIVILEKLIADKIVKIHIPKEIEIYMDIERRKRLFNVHISHIDIHGINILFEKKNSEFAAFFKRLKNIMTKLDLAQETLVVFDGFDDLLYPKENLKSLATLIGVLNNYNVKNIKPVILLRNDKIVLSGENQRILFDRSDTLQWSKKDLYYMVKKRLDANNTSLEELFEKEIYVCKYKKECEDQGEKAEPVAFWDFIVEYTFYRPRDIIAFLNQCKDDFGHKTCIDHSDLKSVLQTYSKTYFFKCVVEELTIYFQNNNIEEDCEVFFYALCEQLCNAVVDNSSTKYWNVMKGFYYKDFYSAANSALSQHCMEEKDIKALFRHLLNIGCIGQLKNKGVAPGNEGVLQWVFSYEDENVECFEAGRYILHKAIRYQFIEEYLPRGEKE